MLISLILSNIKVVQNISGLCFVTICLGRNIERMFLCLCNTPWMCIEGVIVALVESELSPTRFGGFTVGEIDPRYPLNRKLGGPRDEQEGVMKRNAPVWNLTPAVQSVTCHFTDWAATAHTAMRLRGNRVPWLCCNVRFVIEIANWWERHP
jgi:hypothetical protein